MSSKYFIGILGGAPNMFVIGEVDSIQNSSITIKNVFRVIEAVTSDRKITQQYMPDPFFTSDHSSTVVPTQFILHRTIDSEEGNAAVSRYLNELNHFKAARANIKITNAMPNPQGSTPPSGIVIP